MCHNDVILNKRIQLQQNDDNKILRFENLNLAAEEEKSQKGTSNDDHTRPHIATKTLGTNLR